MLQIVETELDKRKGKVHTPVSLPPFPPDRKHSSHAPLFPPELDPRWLPAHAPTGWLAR